MQSLDWDIYRYVVAVADCGSALAAAERLGVDGSTVLRRIRKYEKERSVRLFDRLPTGYSPTVECEQILEAAREIQENVVQIERSISGQDLRLAGRILVTTTDSILEGGLAEVIAEFCTFNPDIKVDLTLTNHHLNLSGQEADVAIRASNNPPDQLVGRRVSEVAFSVYGRVCDYEKRPVDFDRELATGNWVGLGHSTSRSAAFAWMNQHVPPENIKISADSFVAMRTCARDDGGLAVLPCFLGDQDRQLQRVSPLIKELETSLWILSHPDLRRAAKVRAFTSHVGRRLRDKRDILNGRLSR